MLLRAVEIGELEHALGDALVRVGELRVLLVEGGLVVMQRRLEQGQRLLAGLGLGLGLASGLGLGSGLGSGLGLGFARYGSR